MELLSKLSLAKIFGKIDIKALHANGKPVDLYSIGGTVTGIKTGNSTFGEWTSFLGTFGAVRMDTGEVYRAAQVFLPNIATDYLLPVALEAGKNSESIEFGFIVGVKPSKKPDDSDSYEYTVKPILENKVSDPLEGMLKLLASKVPERIAAPVVTETAAAEQAPADKAEAVQAEPAHSKKK